MLRPKKQPPISQMIVENKEDQAEIVKDIDLDTKEFQNALNKHIEIMKQDVRNKSHSLSPCEEKTISYSEFKEFSQKSVPLREGDTGLGRPRKSPIGPPIDMPQEEPIAIIPAASNQQDVKFDENFEHNACHKFIMKINRILIGVLIFVAAILGCFIVTEFAAFCADIQNISFFIKIPSIIFMVLCSIIILIVIVKIIRSICKLHSSPQIHIKELNARNNLHKISEYSIITKKLKSLLNNEYSDIETTLKKLGCEKEKINEIIRKRDKLANDYLRVSSKEWVNSFEVFLRELDYVANMRIKNYAMKASILGTISPFSIFDRFIMLAACLSLVKDLMLIYALKPNWHKSVILISWMIVNSYFAGMVQLGATAIEGVVQNGLNALLEYFKISSVSSWVTTGASKTTGKLSEAMVFYLIISKLGKYVQKQVRPLKMK